MRVCDPARYRALRDWFFASAVALSRTSPVVPSCRSWRRVIQLKSSRSPVIRFLRFTLLGCALAFAGCAVGPDFVTPHVRVTPTLSEAIENADALVLLVGHAQFKALDPQVVRAQTHADVVLDTVNGWNYDAWTAAGFKVVKLGKGQR